MEFQESPVLGDGLSWYWEETLFGIYVIRRLLREGYTSSVIYVHDEKVYVISSDDTIIPLLGANIVKLGLADESDLLLDKRFVVIHDPSRDAKTAVTARTHDAVCRLFLFSYGHGLIREFQDKNFGPERDFWYFMNFWDTLEGRRNESNLKKIRDDLVGLLLTAVRVL